MSPQSPSLVLEFRQYTLRPGRRDELIELFEREFIETQEAAGITLIGLFRDAGRPDRFVWIRAFPDMESRRQALEAFYDGACWRSHRDAANATMLDSDNVLLLRPVADSPPLGAAKYRGPLLSATYLFSSESEAASFAELAGGELKEALKRDGSTTLAILATERSANSFPRLPVREGENAVVLLLDGIEAERLLTQKPAPSEVAHLVPTPRSKVQLGNKPENGFQKSVSRRSEA